MSKPIITIPGRPSSPGTKRPPGPRSLSPLGDAYAIGHDPMGFAMNMWHRYGDIVGIRFLIWPGTLLYHTVEPRSLLVVQPRYGLPMTLQAR